MAVNMSRAPRNAYFPHFMARSASGSHDETTVEHHSSNLDDEASSLPSSDDGSSNFSFDDTTTAASEYTPSLSSLLSDRKHGRGLTTNPSSLLSVQTDELSDDSPWVDDDSSSSSSLPDSGDENDEDHDDGPSYRATRAPKTAAKKKSSRVTSSATNKTMTKQSIRSGDHSSRPINLTDIEEVSHDDDDHDGEEKKEEVGDVGAGYLTPVLFDGPDSLEAIEVQAPPQLDHVDYMSRLEVASTNRCISVVKPMTKAEAMEAFSREVPNVIPLTQTRDDVSSIGVPSTARRSRRSYPYPSGPSLSHRYNTDRDRRHRGGRSSSRHGSRSHDHTSSRRSHRHHDRKDPMQLVDHDIERGQSRGSTNSQLDHVHDGSNPTDSSLPTLTKSSPSSMVTTTIVDGDEAELFHNEYNRWYDVEFGFIVLIAVALVALIILLVLVLLQG